MDIRSRLGQLLPISFLKRPAHRRLRVLFFSALAGLLVFVACIPAIVVPLRHRGHSSSLSTSSDNNTDSAPSIGIIAPTITPVSFTPFPVPSDITISGVFTEADPSKPPAVDKAPGLGGVLPDFAQAWQKAKAKAVSHLKKFSLEDKVALTTGVGWMGGRCVGNIPPVQDFPGLCLEVRYSASFGAECFLIEL